MEAFNRAVRACRERLATSESVIAEVVYVLSSPALYRLPRPRVTAYIRAFVGSRAVQIEHRGTVLHALDRYEANHLAVEDCLSIEHTLRGGFDPIYSYDRGFD